MRRTLIAAAGGLALAASLTACGGGQSAQCRAAIHANNAFVTSFEAEFGSSYVDSGDLNIAEQSAVLAAAARHARLVVRLCGGNTTIDTLKVP